MFFIKILFYPVKFFPRRLEMFLGFLLGLFLYYVIRLRRKIVRKNLLLAFEKDLISGDKNLKDIKSIEFDNYVHYGRLFFELLHLPFDAVNFAKKNVRVHGYENFKKVYEKKQGVFLLTLHIAYWEIMSIVSVLYKVPLNIITKYLRIKILDEIWVKSRTSYGIKLIEESKSGMKVVKALKRGEAVGFILDQYLGPPQGEKYKFFNKNAWTTPSLAWFVLKTGANVVPVSNVRRSDGSFDLFLEPEIKFKEFKDKEESIRENNQIYLNKIEEIIKENPSQWLWLHKRWKNIY
jgi:Kdo2-lipid IVA lauroyltransferase/acyltransferase